MDIVLELHRTESTNQARTATIPRVFRYPAGSSTRMVEPTYTFFSTAGVSAITVFQLAIWTIEDAEQIHGFRFKPFNMDIVLVGHGTESTRRATTAVTPGVIGYSAWSSTRMWPTTYTFLSTAGARAITYFNNVKMFQRSLQDFVS